MQKIAIVTDSTADMPLSYYEENDVTMVPLTVRFGNEEYKDWVEMTPETFFEKLRSSDVLPKTSQPSVQDFIEVYKSHADCDHIISVHISSKLSGTYQSAYVASQDSSVPVTVIDSKLASIGTAAIVDELVRARNNGKTINELISLAGGLIDKIKCHFYIDTLKYLEKGGRIGKASACAGSILNIKPILTLNDGIVAPLMKVKGRKKVFKEMVEIINQGKNKGKLMMCFAHADSPEAIVELKTLLEQEEIDYFPLIESKIGSVIGTYTGPGGFIVVYYPMEEY